MLCRAAAGGCIISDQMQMLSVSQIRELSSSLDKCEFGLKLQKNGKMQKHKKQQIKKYEFLNYSFTTKKKQKLMHKLRSIIIKK
jgi:hypothetical protein